MLNGHSIELATYLAQPALVSKLNREELGALLAQIKTLEGVVLARLLAAPDGDDGQRKPDGVDPPSSGPTAKGARRGHRPARSSIRNDRGFFAGRYGRC